jgi:inner membrane protein
MYPIAHPLVGATLAEAGLRKRTPLATATLVLGANAPDIDIVSAFVSPDESLYFRRGLTHGALSMLVLPFALTGLVLLYDRYVRRRREPDAPPAVARVVLGLAFLSVLTHPFFDWLNTYGVRLLMPFDDRWFYGDALFIVDPWLWLSMAAAVVLARSEGKLSAAAWLILACGASALVFVADLVPLAAKLVWALGVAGIVALRLSSGACTHLRRVAGISLLVLALYVASMIAGTRAARDDVARWLGAQGISATEIAAGPVPANPFVRDVIVRSGDEYHFVRRDFWGEPAFAFSHSPIALGPRDAITRAALDAPEVRGLRAWLRFPAIEVLPTPDGYEVTIRDVRYGRRGPSGLGTAVVRLDHALRPL